MINNNPWQWESPYPLDRSPLTSAFRRRYFFGRAPVIIGVELVRRSQQR